MGTYVPPLPLQNFIPTKTVVTSAWLNQMDHILQGNVPATGVYTPIFNSGQVQLTGPSGYMTSYGDFLFGLTVPGPGGVGPTMLLGGAGKSFSQIVTDEQIPGQKGINVYIAAGESAPGDLIGGGDLWLFGGASAGPGGQMKIQGGTSTQNVAGDVQILGGNSSGGIAAAGNVYILAGTEGNAGGNVKVYATKLNGNAGDISFWLGQPDIPHSVPLWTMSHTGALFPANQGAGNAVDLINVIPASTLLSGGNLASPSWGTPGLTTSFIITVSGAISAPISTFMFVETDGRFVFLSTGPSAVLGTPTGPNDIIISTLPVGIRPASNRLVPVVGLTNGGQAGFYGQALVDINGGITISVANSTGQINPNAWSVSGSKGLSANWALYYAI